MTDTLEELIDAVAKQLMQRDMENETCEKGCALNGLLSTDRDRFIAHARDLIDRSVATQTDTGVPNYDDPNRTSREKNRFRRGRNQLY